MFLSGFFDEQKVKNNSLFEMENFCNIINIFTDTFDQINASLSFSASKGKISAVTNVFIRFYICRGQDV